MRKNPPEILGAILVRALHGKSWQVRACIASKGWIRNPVPPLGVKTCLASLQHSFIVQIPTAPSSQSASTASTRLQPPFAKIIWQTRRGSTYVFPVSLPHAFLSSDRTNLAVLENKGWIRSRIPSQVRAPLCLRALLDPCSSNQRFWSELP